MIKDIFKKITDLKDISLTEIEKVKKMTDPDGWGPTLQEKEQICDSAHIYQNLQEIFGVLEKRLSDENRRYKGHIKALGIIRFLLVHGPSSCVDQTKYLEHNMRSLTTFFHTDQNGREIGNGVRQAAKEVVKMVKSPEYLKKQKKEGRRMKSRFKGFSKNEMQWRREFKHEESFNEEKSPEPESSDEEEAPKPKPKKKKKKTIRPPSDDESEEETVSNVVIKVPKGKRKKKKREKKKKIRRPSFGNDDKPQMTKKKEPKKPEKKPEPKPRKEATLLSFFDAPTTGSSGGGGGMFNTPAPEKTTQSKAQQRAFDFFDADDTNVNVLKPQDGLMNDSELFDDNDDFGKNFSKKEIKKDNDDLLGILSGLSEDKKKENSPTKKMTINQIRDRKGKKPAQSTIMSHNTATRSTGDYFW